MDPSPGSESRPDASQGARLARALREHPVTVGVFVVGVISGIVLAFVLPIAPDDMPAWKRVLGGAILGGWLALFPLGFRLFD
jgi:hypothetical protein